MSVAIEFEHAPVASSLEWRKRYAKTSSARCASTVVRSCTLKSVRMPTVWLLMYSTVAPMARGGEGDIHGNNVVQESALQALVPIF